MKSPATPQSDELIAAGGADSVAALKRGEDVTTHDTETILRPEPEPGGTPGPPAGEHEPERTSGRQARQLPEPHYRGPDSCDFCGGSLKVEDRLYGACDTCAAALAEAMR